MSDDPLRIAVAVLASACSSGSSAFGELTCDEADALAHVLALAGHMNSAADVLVSHAEGDLPGDRHRIDDDLCSDHASELATRWVAMLLLERSSVQ